MSTTPRSAPSPQPDGSQLLVPEAVLRDIAQELGTAIINRIMLADAVRRQQAQLSTPVEPGGDGAAG